MPKLRRTFIAALASLALSSHAQSFPEKPVKIVVPFTAGGASDGLTRALAVELGKEWNQSVVVDNKPGANTIIAAQTVAQAAPDGYTLLLATDSTLSINPFLYRKLPYDPATFDPVVNLAGVNEMLVVSAATGVTTLPQFVAQAKAQPGKYAYASFGIGSSPHLDGSSFARLAQVNLLHVPYKGVADATQALISGEVHMLIAGMAQPLPLVRAGKLVALAVALPARSPLLPEVPTFAELGMPSMSARPWIGLVAPANTPLDIRRKIARSVDRIINSPSFRQTYLTGVGMDPIGGTVEGFGDFLKRDRQAYEQKVKAANAAGHLE